SAGGYMATSTYLHLTTSRPNFSLSGLLLNYGIYDLSLLPSVHNFKKPATLMLDEESMTHFRDAFCPGMSYDQLGRPSVSPFHANLRGLDLPPAMFVCGTEDCLLDDTVMMAARWMMSGGKAVVRIVAGAPHGFTLFPWEFCAEAKVGVEDGCAFVREMTRG
ncbi:MAG: hypothetical protein Q9192_005375, partial [Flavoplaca navasiana]